MAVYHPSMWHLKGRSHCADINTVLSSSIKQLKKISSVSAIQDTELQFVKESMLRLSEDKLSQNSFVLLIYFFQSPNKTCL